MREAPTSPASLPFSGKSGRPPRRGSPPHHSRRSTHGTPPAPRPRRGAGVFRVRTGGIIRSHRIPPPSGSSYRRPDRRLSRHPKPERLEPVRPSGEDEPADLRTHRRRSPQTVRRPRHPARSRLIRHLRRATAGARPAPTSLPAAGTARGGQPTAPGEAFRTDPMITRTAKTRNRTVAVSPFGTGFATVRIN